MIHFDNNIILDSLYNASIGINQQNEYSVYHYIKDAKLYYPNFDIWYFANVIPSLKNGSKKILLSETEGNLRGLAILKYSEKKLCHLSVINNYKNKGYGIKLFKQCFEELKTEKPFLTVSEEKLPEFKRIFNYFNFKLTNIVEDCYRKGKKEFFYNQE